MKMHQLTKLVSLILLPTLLRVASPAAAAPAKVRLATLAPERFFLHQTSSGDGR